jgi:hypothetical protein
MPLKTWVDYERLEAPDLNGAFTWSQDQTTLGAWSTTSGPETGSIAVNAYAEVQHGPINTDFGGIWQSGGRVRIPSLWPGLWLYTASVVGLNAGTNGDTMQLYLNVDGVRAGFLGSCSRTTGGGQGNAASGSIALTLNGGTTMFLEARMISSTGTAICRNWSLMRLGRGLGNPGGPVLPIVNPTGAQAKDGDDR